MLVSRSLFIYTISSVNKHPISMEGSSPSAHPAEAFSTNIALLPRPLIVEVWTHKPNHKLTHKDEANAKGDVKAEKGWRNGLN